MPLHADIAVDSGCQPNCSASCLLQRTRVAFGDAGISNDKAIHIEGDGQGLKITKLITKHSNKPSKAKSSSTRKKSFQRVSAGLTKELDGYRPDLKVHLQLPCCHQMCMLHVLGAVGKGCTMSQQSI